MHFSNGNSARFGRRPVGVDLMNVVIQPAWHNQLHVVKLLDALENRYMTAKRCGSATATRWINSGRPPANRVKFVLDPAFEPTEPDGSRRDHFRPGPLGRARRHQRPFSSMDRVLLRHQFPALAAQGVEVHLEES